MSKRDEAKKEFVLAMEKFGEILDEDELESANLAAEIMLNLGSRDLMKWIICHLISASNNDKTLFKTVQHLHTRIKVLEQFATLMGAQNCGDQSTRN